MISVSVFCKTSPAKTEAHSAGAKPDDAAETADDDPNEKNSTQTDNFTTQVNDDKYTPLNYKNLKAMWLSQFDMQYIYSDGKRQRDKADYTARVNEIMTNIASLGFNTVIVQLRPYADSFYPSEIYPPSSVVTGSYSADFNYDPTEILVNLAHQNGLSFQAWINPMRCMKESEIKDVSDNYAIKQWYTDGNKNIALYNGRLYLDPASEESRSLIINGIDEIIKKYDVDGIHIDDYFYPTASPDFDSANYDEYLKNGGTMALADFRKDRLNKLIKGIYSKVKSNHSSLLFGISPAGIVGNTLSAYADVYTWGKEYGYADYICPQIYFGFEHETQDFVKLCRQWQDIVTNKNVGLIIGMSLEKANTKYDKWAGDGQYEWEENNDILKRCLEYTMTLEKCTGAAYFSYQFFYGVTGNDITPCNDEKENLLPVLKYADWS